MALGGRASRGYAHQRGLLSFPGSSVVAHPRAGVPRMLGNGLNGPIQEEPPLFIQFLVPSSSSAFSQTQIPFPCSNCHDLEKDPGRARQLSALRAEASGALPLQPLLRTNRARRGAPVLLGSGSEIFVRQHASQRSGACTKPSSPPGSATWRWFRPCSALPRTRAMKEGPPS